MVYSSIIFICQLSFMLRRLYGTQLPSGTLIKTSGLCLSGHEYFIHLSQLIQDLRPESYAILFSGTQFWQRQRFRLCSRHLVRYWNDSGTYVAPQQRGREMLHHFSSYLPLGPCRHMHLLPINLYVYWCTCMYRVSVIIEYNTAC